MYPVMRLLSARRLSEDGTAIALSLKRPEAFTVVFDRHFIAVHRYLARRTDRDQADDLASQTFTVAFANRGRYRDELGTARPWLFGIATNLLRAEYRGQARATVVVDRLAVEAAHSSSVTVLRAASYAAEDDERLSVALSGSRRNSGTRCCCTPLGSSPTRRSP